MISFIGEISGSLKAPCIYFIVKLNYLYIGETQSHPIFRWACHLRPEGSFSKKLKGIDAEALLHSSESCFFAYRCNKILDDFPILNCKQATQLIEHYVHIEALSNPVTLGRKFEIISDTEKTAPRNFRYPNAQVIAMEIIKDFSLRLKNPSFSPERLFSK